MEPGLHKTLEPIAFLLGTWRGGGTAEYPTTETVRYGEEMRFTHVGEAFLLYSQRSWLEADGSPLHFECGFYRPVGDDRIEIVLAHPLGIVEVAAGTVSGSAIDAVSISVKRTPTADPVTQLARRLVVRDEVLSYELLMATRDVPLSRHLTGELKRT